MEENKSENIKESDFNAGIATLRRLDELKKNMIYDTINNEPEGLFFHLKAFWKELDPIINTTFQKAQLENYLGIYDLYRKWKKNELNKEALVARLDEWELELRGLEQKYKLNMPMGRDKRWVV